MYKIYTKNFYWPISRLIKNILLAVGGVLRLDESLKRQLIMGGNFTTVLLIVTMMQVSAAGFAQKITFVQKDASMHQIFRAIKQQTGYDVLWPAKSVKTAKSINASFRNIELKDVLKSTFENQPFAYVIEDKVIVVKEKKATLLDKIINAFSEIEVTGKVIDANGKPLVKATVKSKKGNRMTFTDAYGDFKLSKVDEDDLLIISFLGYESREVKAEKKMGSIQLLESAAALEEVVISNGYQDIKKSMNTGSISRVKGEDLEINGVSTIEQLLQGELAGLEVVNTSGVVGTRQKVRVRGTSTLLGNQDPVWVVDGIIQEDPLPFKPTEINNYNTGTTASDAMKEFVGSAISWLSPYDIEDVTVLKDAASTAIYGVKAANGVILITTKKGKEGAAPTVSYSTNMSFSSQLSYDKLNLMNSKERVDVSREIYNRRLMAFTGRGLDDIGYQGVLKQFLNKEISYDDFNSSVKQLEVNNTDWFDILFQVPFSQAHNVSVSGGGNNSTYYGSFGYNSNIGQAVGNSQDGYTGSINFTSKISKKLSFSTRLSGSYGTTSGFYDGTSPYTYATNTNRVFPVYNADGSLFYYPTAGGYNYNILNELANSGNDNKKAAINTSINVKYQLPAGFALESTLGVGITSTHAESFASETTNSMTAKRGYEYGEYTPVDAQYKASILPNGGVLNLSENRNFNYTWRNNLTYQHLFNEKHMVTAMGGIEVRSNQYTGSNSTLYGYMPFRGKGIVAPPATIINAISGSPVNNSIYSENLNSITDNLSNYASYYVTGAYSYDERYVFNMSLRGDASNRFGQDTRARFTPIWAIGGKWNVAREHWFEKTDWFNDFSIRATYGYQGNVAENYGPDLVARIPLGSEGINSQTGEPILKISSLPYADLRMERTQTINLGLDFSFFANRISASVDAYTKKSKDLIVLKDIPYEFGVTQMPVNSGDVTNSGIDITLNFVPIRNKDITWNFGINSTFVKNTVKNKLLPNSKWFNATTGRYFVEGYAVSSFWVFDYVGPDATTGVPTFNIPVTVDGKNDATAYMVYAGKLNADFTSGFNTSFRYKRLTFSASMYLSLGGKKLLPRLYSLDMMNSTPNEYNNLSADLVDRWRKPGDELITNNPGLPYYGTGGISVPGEITSYSPYLLYNSSTARVVNASYFRVNNINLNYRLPDHITKRFLSKSTSVGYSLSNPFRIVSKDFKGIDPEVASGNQPLARLHTFKLSVTF